MRAFLNFGDFILFLESKKMNKLLVKGKFDPKVLKRFEEFLENGFEEDTEFLFEPLRSLYFEVTNQPNQQGLIWRNDKIVSQVYPLRSYYKGYKNTLNLCRKFLLKKLKNKTVLQE